MKRLWVIAILSAIAGGFIIGKITPSAADTAQVASPNASNPYANERELFRKVVLDPTGHAVIIAIGITETEYNCGAPHYAILHKLPPDTTPDVILPGSEIYAWARDGSQFALETWVESETMTPLIVSYDAAGDTLASYGPGYCPTYAEGNDTIYFFQDVPSPDLLNDLGYLYPPAISNYPNICAYDVHLGTQTIIASFDKMLTFFPPNIGGDARLTPVFETVRDYSLSGFLYSRSGNPQTPLYRFTVFQHAGVKRIEPYRE